MAKAVKSETKSKKTKENKVSAIRHNDTYSKGNLLITAKYRSSLLENKLLAIALANIQNSYEDDNGNLQRTTLSKTRSKIEFETPYLRYSDKRALMTGLSSEFSKSQSLWNERKVQVTYFNDESDTYDTKWFYIPDIQWQYYKN